MTKCLQPDLRCDLTMEPLHEINNLRLTQELGLKPLTNLPDKPPSSLQINALQDILKLRTGTMPVP